MDMLFRFLSPQSSSHHHHKQSSSSYNLSQTSSSSRSSAGVETHQPSNYYFHQNSSGAGYHIQEECGANPQLYMDEDFSSSSSSKHFHHHNPPSAASASPAPSSFTPLFDPADLSFPHDLNLDFFAAGAAGGGAGGRWASQLLLECARAVAVRDSHRVQQLMWMLNEVASPYGDTEQKVAAYFSQGLFARLTSSGPRTLRTLSAACDRNSSFDATRRTALRFQEVSPWSSFGHVAANGAILEAFLEPSGAPPPPRLHILDFSRTFCTQWPTLLEALATRSADDTPHLTITTVAPSTSAAGQRVMREIGQRMEKFARLMGVPFRFNAIHHTGDLSELDLDGLDLGTDDADSAIAVNFVNSLHGVSPGPSRRRDALLRAVRQLQPRIVTVVEEEADLEWGGGEEEGEEYLRGFGESLRFFTAYFESLEESFPRTSNERLALERAAGRAVVDLVACPARESGERRDTSAGWARRMRATGFAPAAFSDDVADDVRALLRRYKEGWSMRAGSAEGSDEAAGIFLEWKEQAVVWASAWRP